VNAGRRVAIAAVVMAALLAALLGAWYVTGTGDVHARQLAVESAPVAAATARAGELARQLRGELDQLVSREARRPYFHYQNLFHDPKASAGPSVTPSPLASGSDDPLVLGYFQIDADGHVTTPAINDEFPQLSELVHLVEHRAFRDAVARLLAKSLTPERAKPGTLVASIDPPGHAPIGGTPRTGSTESAVQPATANTTTNATNATANPPPGTGQTITSRTIDNTATTIEIDTSSYAQNNNANAVYGQNVPRHVVPPVDAGVPDAPPDAPPDAAVAIETVATPPPVVKPPPPPRPRPAPPKPAPAVTISISALEWHTLPFLGGPSLVAVRQVQTPDGNFAQGFVVDRAALTQWLADHGDDLVAELHTGTANAAAEIIPGWELAVHPNPRAVAAAASDAARIATAFLIRFVLVAAIAVLAALLVVWLVARAERYARERSQFAAAAAHELRTPLAGLQLYGDMLADGLGDPGKLRDYARRMSEEASRLGRVVSNVLGFSQLERGNLSIDPKPGNVAAALRELAEHAQPALDRAGAMIALDVPDELAARFDRDALARIIGNLIDNAEKYARGAGDRTIELAAKRVDAHVEISVRDHGGGVANPTRLFTAFHRGVTADGPAGLGLGLALSRSLAQAMGGELAYRTGDAGATFVVTLPI
jgi:signal transduction histidine kinase